MSSSQLAHSSPPIVKVRLSTPSAGQIKEDVYDQQQAPETQQSIKTSTRSTSSAVSQVTDDERNSVGNISGTSKFLKPYNAGIVAEADIAVDGCCFLCRPCSCPTVCSCASKEFVKRSYMRIYENRLEANLAWTPASACCCCKWAPKGWVRDHVVVYYFDQPPTTTGTYFPWCCPLTCMGRPTVWTYQVSTCCFCCGKLDVLGWSFNDMCASCNPACWGRPLLGTYYLKAGGDSVRFLAAYKAAYESYAQKRGIPKTQQARFFYIKPGCPCIPCPDAKEVSTDMWDMHGAQGCYEMGIHGPEEQQTMER